ncbi:hypothetical protein [Vibrio sp. Isolate30]|uniref:hypothetical protein n=1 Tax=Vibrio sp. Isolate30 TaxID=2908536 RepID=UPI001EFD0EC2|nr:hypothetical protein [Vibrio sp. Isolate30]MCG9632265.1 hypothetical protein [Vibrio sp. Isolate30]
MAKFSSENQPAKRRGRGKSKLSKILDENTISDAKRQLSEAVKAGEQWAIVEVLKRIAPPLKPVTDADSLDGQYLELKMKEISEFEQRILALEESLNESRE